MIKDTVEKINELEKQLEQETQELSIQDAIKEANNYLQAAEHIEASLNIQYFRDKGWNICIHNYDEIRIWNIEKSYKLENGEYYHVYFDKNFKVKKSTVSDKDLITLKKILNPEKI